MARFTLLLVCSTLVTCAGCIEQSVVVKVNEDDSAVIHVRHYSEQPTSPFGSSQKEDAKPKTPSAEEVLVVANHLGEGVRVTQIREGKNSSGWHGYEVILECDDINKIRLDVGALSSMELKSEEEKRKGGPQMHGHLLFEQTDGELTIKTESEADAQAEGDGPTRNPFAKSKPIAPANPIAASLLSGIVKRVRVGVFVQVEGRISSTNARHVDDGLITLSSIDGSQLDDETVQELLALGSMDRENQIRVAHRLADDYSGLQFDLQPVIKVKRK